MLIKTSSHFLLFFWLFLMHFHKAGVTPWVAEVDQHWPCTSSLPPSTLPCHFSFFLPCPFPNPKLSCYPLQLAPLLTSGSGLWCTLPGPARPGIWSEQVCNTESRSCQGVGLEFLSKLDQASLFSSLIKTNRIFATYNLQHHTRSWKEPKQQLDMKADRHLLINFTD